MLRKLVLVLLFVFLFTGIAFAEPGDDFPDNPGYPELLDGYVFAPRQPPGGGRTSQGTAQSPYNLWGVPAGSRVFFDYVLDWGSFTYLWSSPVSNQGDDFVYLGDNGDYNQRWDWDAGTFCWRCPWVFRATEDNPEIGIDFVRSGRFGGYAAHVEVTEVVLPVVSRENKERAFWLALTANTLTQVAAGAAAATCALGFYNQCFVHTVIAFGAGYAAIHYTKIWNDPWDDNYGSPYDWTDAYYEDAPNYDWACPAVAAYGDEWLTNICMGLVYYQTTVNAFAKAAGISADRAESCIVVRNFDCFRWQRGRSVDYQRALGNEMYSLGLYYLYLRDYMNAYGLNDENNTVGILDQHGNLLMAWSDAFYNAP